MSGNGFSFSIDGLDRVIGAFGQTSEATQNRILRKMQASADNTLTQAQATAPVDSGDLQGSGRVEPEVTGDRESIAFAVVFGDGESTPTQYKYPGIDDPANGYAFFVELGTTKMAAQPFLGPAFEEQSQILLDSLGDILS